MQKINVFEKVGKNAISMQNGQKLYDLIAPKLTSGNDVELNFEEVSLFASPFFNASIGLLLKDVPIEELMKHLQIHNLNEIGRDLLNNVINNAITFHGNDSISNFLTSEE